MADILIDKSWVHGASVSALTNVAARHRLLMPEALFYEILTTKDEERRRCFGRLSMIESSISLLCGIPDLFRYEAATGKPAVPLRERCIGPSISFHPEAGKSGYPFSAEQIAVIEAERTEREGAGLQDAKEMSSLVSGWFPDLKGLPLGSPRERIEPYLKRVATDTQMVRDIYGDDGNWTFFRHVQVKLVGALEYTRRFGDRNKDAEGKKIPNFFLDQEYLIPALLADGLASSDGEMQAFYELLAPEKERIFSE
jgi:hypothetical protein